MDAFEPQPQYPIRTSPKPSRAFSITELLVVIAIIVLLAGLLIVAMGKVRESSLRTATLSTMQNFGRAADAFQTEHGFYPGVIPEQVLAEAIAGGKPGFGDSGAKWLSSTENALLHLMGGYRVCPPTTPGCNPLQEGKSPIADDFIAFANNLPPAPVGQVLTIGTPVWRLAINLNLIGEGPFINGKPYAPYYTPGPNEVRTVRGQVNDARLPDLVDAWGNPILYTRRLRTSGPLVGAYDDRPQFIIEGLRPYLSATSLGERGHDQTHSDRGSLLYEAGIQNVDVHARFAQIIRHPAFGSWEVGPLEDDNRGRVAPRGEYVLISAGPDGIYFSRADGPGSPREPIPDETPDIIPNGDNSNSNPRVIDSFDDIVIFGGG